MDSKIVIRLIGLVFAGVLVAACGSSEPDLAATRRTEVDVAVAATLTAAAPPAETSGEQVAQASTDEPGATAADLDTPAPPPPGTTSPGNGNGDGESQAVTATPITQPTSTPTSETAQAPQTAPSAAPSPTPVVVVVLPVDGGGGDILNIRNNNPVKDGRNVTLPGFTQAEVAEPMVFRDRMVFQVEVSDRNVGTEDGAGIDNVQFTITDDRGEEVHYRQENSPGYCVFGGGEPDCNVWVFAETGYRWPGGARLFPVLHNVTIDIQPQNGDAVQWFWSFQAALPHDAARINGISVQGGYYAVDFETFGFTPEVPGQHVHFFFDTVPPEQAGAPGSGPWALYGGPSPFTGYGPGDRPQGATQMCVLVANADHSVQANTGNCAPLP